ncbi:E3 ubiquitin protein ligase DRIP2 isoform X2 [Cannabis sativa]|uniref:E3 ubiquitin protein ligase DRIP2 isoform X2 n=1 Tax=Cannabis sativa TaxID=3483 RepID=UPI0029C9EA6D|nr:E3 ubiquitin protein ligase DRIP2 isoform X2 [Cannabis sativa]
MANQVVKVSREPIEACMTCPLCHKLFRDATTISECLHTFCRKCIYDKLSDEELECCPTCNIHLGCVPLEKLRPDHNLQDLRAKVFPIKRRKVKAAEVVTPVTLPVRRKERSLSSLVINTPRVSAHATMTGRRTKSVTRKAAALRGCGFSAEKPVKREDDSVENHQESSSSPEPSNKLSPHSRQSSIPSEPSEPLPDKETGNGAKSWEGKLDLWKPLTCLVEVANRTKSVKSSSQGSDNKAEPTLVADIELQARRTKIKEYKRKTKVEDDKNVDPVYSASVKPIKVRRVRRKRETAFGESMISPQAVLDAASARHERRVGPIWFSLIASDDQDGNLPVSFIQKYLMMKLALTNEAEVEIKCMGQPVVPTLQLYNLVDLWLQTTSTSERIPATIGSSAKDFVMVLAYARKTPES